MLPGGRWTHSFDSITLKDLSIQVLWNSNVPGKRKSNRSKSPSYATHPVSGNASSVQVRKVGEDSWELVHPRCAMDRHDDLEEVRKMIEADEIDVARDELRWLLNGCSDNIAAHQLLGEIALLDHDLPLARGHFGYAYQIGTKAIGSSGVSAKLPYRLLGNQTFFQASKGLIYCLKELGKLEMAGEVIQRLLAFDPSDPLAMRSLLPVDPSLKVPLPNSPSALD